MVVQLCPPASPYIKKSFKGNLMYEMVGGYINKYVDSADANEFIFNRHLSARGCIPCWLWNDIGFRPRLSDSLIDKITTLS